MWTTVPPKQRCMSPVSQEKEEPVENESKMEETAAQTSSSPEEEKAQDSEQQSDSQSTSQGSFCSTSCSLLCHNLHIGFWSCRCCHLTVKTIFEPLTTSPFGHGGQLCDEPQSGLGSQCRTVRP